MHNFKDAAFALGLGLAACGGTAGPDGPGGSACALTANTSPSGVTSPSGCAVLDRDTSGCEAARKAAGLSGYWLKFSCRVTLSVSGGQVQAASDGQPDYASNYFPKTNVCYEKYTGAIQNPNQISQTSYSVSFPMSPSTASQSMMGVAVVGLALNGVPIFANFAAPGDDIYVEAMTFDRCGAHPQMRGAYHYHGEPYALSYDDGRFIGVMRDGYAIYGRKDPDGSYPTLDAFGGHSGATADSAGAAVYHYHLNEQTSTASTSRGQKQWFLTKGGFRGAPAACTGCQ